MKKVIEVVIYEQKKGVTDEMILNQSQKLQEVIVNLKGLISRKLAKSPNGQWMDYVLWHTMEDAVSAGKVIEENDSSSAFMSLVKAESISMTHYTVEDDYL